MPTLAEQLEQLRLCEQQTSDLKNTIKEFVSQERIFDMLKKALTNKFTAKIPYQRFDNEGYVELEPTSTSTFSGYNAYNFIIEAEPRRVLLEARIIFDGKNVSVQMIEYRTDILTKETIIDSLKQVIGVENKIK